MTLIESWEKKLEKLGKEETLLRLRRYLGSLALGREFGETMEDYLNRKGYAEFYTWAHKQLES